VQNISSDTLYGLFLLTSGREQSQFNINFQILILSLIQISQILTILESR
jgi:hypothetical protein